MKKRQLERKFRELLTIKPVIVQEGRLIAHLLHELTLNPDRNGCRASMIKVMLDAMAASGEIILTKRGEVYDAVEVIVAPSPTDLEQQPEEVQVIETMQPSITREDTPEVTSTPIAKRPKSERLSLALMALQAHANEIGEIHEPRTDVIIERELEVTLYVAQSLNRTLGQLGLRRSSRGRNAKPAWVNMNITDITDEMLASIDKKSKKDEQSASPVISVGEAAPKIDVDMSPAQREEALGKIILKLEQDLDVAQETIRRHELSIEQGQAYMSAAREKIEEQKVELTEKDEVIGQLTAQLEPLRAIGQLRPSSTTVDILQRHGHGKI